MFLLVVPDGVAQLVARRLAHLRCCYVGEGRGPDPMAGYIYMASPTHEVLMPLSSRAAATRHARW